MATFQFIAKDSAGQERRGTIDAGDRAGAIAAIRAQGLFPTAIGEVKGGGAPAPAKAGKKPAKAPAAKAPGGKKKGLGSMEIKLPAFLRGRVKTKDLTSFTRQLATLVNAGLPLMRCIEVMKKQKMAPAMKDCLDGISEGIAGGATFSESLTAYPKIFDNLYINMVKAGEAGGVLEVVLSRLAEFAEKAEKIKNKVKGAMIYPIVVLTAAIGITAFLLLTVIPKFKQVFDDILGGQELPGITQFVMNLADFVKNNGLVVAAGVVGIVMVKKLVGKTAKGAYLFDKIKLKMPVIGPLVNRTAIAQFTRTLGTLLSSGVPILQSLVIVRDTTANRVVRRAVQTVHDAVKEGESMTDPLASALPDMLTRIANTYDDEVDNAVAGLTAAIEPALIIFLAVVVGTIVVAMFLPMIKIISSVSGAGG